MNKRVAIIIAIILIIFVIIFSKNRGANLKVEYELKEVNKFSYVKFIDNDNYGVMDRSGKVLINAKYKKVEIPNPEKDLFICYDEQGKTTVFNAKGEEQFNKYEKVEPIKFKNIASILSFEKDTLKYEKDGKYGLIDFSGKEITSNKYDSIENLLGTEGKFLISKENKFGVINKNGLELIGTEYDKIETDNYYDESNKYIEAGFIVSNTTQDGYRYGYISFNGEKILDVEYNNIARIPTKEIFLVVSKNGKYGLYEGKNELIKTEYQSISYTDNGAIIIEKNKQYGIATLKGEIKVETKYDEIEERGIYLYAQNERSNDVYDINGNKIEINFSKTVYETEKEYFRIITLINNEQMLYGIEDGDGKTLINAGYKYIEYVFGDYFLAEDENGKYGVLNGNGKKLISFEYDLIQKIKDKFILQASKKGDKNSKFFNINLEEVLNIKSAKVDNKNNYVKIYNNDEEKYLDKDGNKINSDSEVIKNETDSELPATIGEYEKYQVSLDDVYYRK